MTGSAGYETWTITWLPINKIDRITRPDGISYKMLYDSAHDLVEVQEHSGSGSLLGKRVFTLDLMGRLTLEETFDGNSVKLSSGGKSYNPLSRLSSTIAAQSQSSTFIYDADGNLTGVSDPLSHTTGASVDALGRTVEMIDQLNKTSTLTYDTQDNITLAIDARGIETSYAYNAFNDLLAISSPDRGSSAFAVDANGNTISTVDARGVAGTVVYDNLDRPLSISWSDDGVVGSPSGFTPGDKVATYTWDTCQNGIGRLCSKSDWTGAYAYSYDLWGRLTGQSFAPSGESFTLSTGYGYDAFGRQDALVYPSGKALTFTYGSDGQVSTMNWASSNLISGLAYHSMGGPVSGWAWGAPGIPAAKSHQQDLEHRWLAECLWRHFQSPGLNGPGCRRGCGNRVARFNGCHGQHHQRLTANLYLRCHRQDGGHECRCLRRGQLGQRVRPARSQASLGCWRSR